MSGARARANGTSHRTLDATVTDTVAWLKQRPQAEKRMAGWPRERELAVLAEWHVSRR